MSSGTGVWPVCLLPKPVCTLSLHVTLTRRASGYKLSSCEKKGLEKVRIPLAALLSLTTCAGAEIIQTVSCGASLPPSIWFLLRVTFWVSALGRQRAHNPPMKPLLGAALRKQREGPWFFSKLKVSPPAGKDIYGASLETPNSLNPFLLQTLMESVISHSCQLHSVNLRGKFNLMDMSSEQCPIRTHSTQTKI